jgi:hypothetical protein
MTRSCFDSAAQAERALLGSILLENSLWPNATVLSVEDFCLDSHRQIFRHMAAMFEDRLPVDLVTLTDRLMRLHLLESCGNAAYIATLIDLAVPENINAYVSSIRAAAVERRVAQQIELLSVTSAMHSPGKLPSIREQAQSLLDSLAGAQIDDISIHKTASIPDIFSLEMPDVDYIVPDILPRGNVVLWTGNPGCGKSFFSLAMSVSIATGSEFLSRACVATRVLIIDKENPVQLQRQRLRTLAGGRIPELKIWGGWLRDPPPMLDDVRLRTIAKEERPVIIFDSLVRFHDADENAASEMRHVMAHVRRLADLGATVILVHHKPKSDDLLYRGSSDILAAVDMAFVLEMKGPGQLRLRCFKSRLSEDRTFTITANFAQGKFGLTDSSFAVHQQDEVEILTEIISRSPGCSTNEIERVSGLRRTRVLNLLHKHTGRHWRVQPGPRNAKMYYPLGHERLDRGLVPPTPSGTTARNHCATGSLIDSHYPEPVGTTPVVPSISTP